MQNIALSWQQAGTLSAGLFCTTGLGRLWLVHTLPDLPARAGRQLTTVLVPMLTEIGIIAALYAIWQLAGTAPVFDAAGAVGRGERIVSWEHAVGLPSEEWAQRPLLAHPLAAQAANLYYATMHFAAVFALLIWVWFRHRERYRLVRTVLVTLTAACFVIQFIPVAPPRLLPGYGFVDTAERYGQSVYSAFGAIEPDQLSAMPSLHVGWALLVSATIITVSTSRWRWLFLSHALITSYVVSATANHYWADGMVAALLLVLSAGVVFAARRLTTRGIAQVQPWGQRLASVSDAPNPN